MLLEVAYVHPCTVFLDAYISTLCVFYVLPLLEVPVFLSVAAHQSAPSTAKTKYEYVTVP